MTLAHIDDVVIEVNGEDLKNVTSYSMRMGVFTAPGTLTFSLGDTESFTHLASKCLPMSPYRFKVNGINIQAGYLTGFSRGGGAGDSIQLVGHTKLSRLMLAEVDKTRTFKSETYADLVLAAIEAIGFKDMVLVADNTANERATGKNITVQQPKAGDGRAASQHMFGVELKAEIGTSWWGFIQQQLQLADLFLWDDAEGLVILSQPNVENTPALFNLTRVSGYNDILSDGFSSDMAKRHSECIVYSRAGGGKNGVASIKARYIDEEMVALLNPNPDDRKDGGVVRIPNAQRDKKVYSKEHAERLARRTIAAERREAWVLPYTVQGHSIENSRGERVLFLPDTVFDVNDEELGLEGPLWIESVEYSGTPTSTTTVIRAMRPADLVFIDPSTMLKPVKSKGKKTPSLATWGYPYVAEGGSRVGLWRVVKSPDAKVGTGKSDVVPGGDAGLDNILDQLENRPNYAPIAKPSGSTTLFESSGLSGLGFRRQ